MSEYLKDRKESDKYLGFFMEELTEYFKCQEIYEANDYQDMREASDLVMVIDGREYRVAVRTRKFEDIKYKDQFTIRNKRFKNKDQCEYEKIIKGFGDYMVYGFINQMKTGVCFYSILDLSVFREFIKQGGKPVEEKFNHDRSSSFLSFSLYECYNFNKGFILYRFDKIKMN